MPYRHEGVPPVFRPDEFEVLDRTPQPSRLERLFRIGPESPLPYGCGHAAPVRFALRIHGRIREMSDAYFEERPLCPECIRIMTIRCAHCGQPIMPGESVACVIDKEDWVTPDARPMRGGDRSVVICFRPTCAGPYPEMGGGFWNGREVAGGWDLSGTRKDP